MGEKMGRSRTLPVEKLGSIGGPPLLPEIRAASRARLDEVRTSHRYRRGQVLHYEGNPCTGVHVIGSGRAKLVRAAASGRHCILRIANPGDLLGLDALLAPERRYSTSAVMLEDGTVSFLEREALLEVVLHDPTAAEAILAILSGHVRESDEERVELVGNGVRERTARVLVRLARDHGVATGSGVLIRPKLTREEIAEMVGSAAETVTRQLGEFRECDLVRLDGRRIVVRDVERLSRIAHLGQTPVS